MLILTVLCIYSKLFSKTYNLWGFSGGSAGKESACNVGDLGSTPRLGRSPGEGNGYPLQYSGLENSMDCTIRGVAKSQTWLSDFHLPFPASLAGIESTWNSGDPSSIPGSGRSPGEGIGYPHQYSWSPLVAQTVKNLPAMLETWVRSLGWEDPLEEGLATHSSILAWRIPWTDEPSGLQFRMSWRVGHDWATKQP